MWYSEGTQLFCAEKDGWDFMAESPCGLLGVISMYEFHQPTNYQEYWWKLDTETLYHNLPKKPKRYVPVTRKK